MLNTVLIVDDYADSRSFLKSLFELGGYRVIEACDEQEAVERAEAEQPDLILMDMLLPEIGAVTTSRTIKEKMSRFKTPTIIGVTPYINDYQAIAMKAGCKIAPKNPISFDALDSVITMYLIS